MYRLVQHLGHRLNVLPSRRPVVKHVFLNLDVGRGNTAQRISAVECILRRHDRDAAVLVLLAPLEAELLRFLLATDKRLSCDVAVLVEQLYNT